MRVGDDFDVPPNPCLSCGHVNDGALSLDSEQRPKPGDVTLCVRCGFVMSFDENLSTRQLSPTEALVVLSDPRIAFLKTMVVRANRERRES